MKITAIRYERLVSLPGHFENVKIGAETILTEEDTGQEAERLEGLRQWIDAQVASDIQIRESKRKITAKERCDAQRAEIRWVVLKEEIADLERRLAKVGAQWAAAVTFLKRHGLKPNESFDLPAVESVDGEDLSFADTNS